MADENTFSMTVKVKAAWPFSKKLATDDNIKFAIEQIRLRYPHIFRGVGEWKRGQLKEFLKALESPLRDPSIRKQYQKEPEDSILSYGNMGEEINGAGPFAQGCGGGRRNIRKHAPFS